MDTWVPAVEKEVERLLGGVPLDSEWQLRSVQDRLQLQKQDPVRVANLIADVITEVRRAGWVAPERADLRLGPMGEYWQLLTELDEKETRRLGLASNWVPLRVSVTPWFIWGDSATTVQPRVQIDFDHRMSQRELVRAIRASWNRLVRCGWLRQTRTLQPRASALVRFVCLESEPGSTWRERMRRWNSSVAVEWKYDDVRLFQRDFQRAEKQLTGEVNGLEGFYRPAAMLPSDERQARIEQGDREATAYGARRRDRAGARSDENRRMSECGDVITVARKPEDRL